MFKKIDRQIFAIAIGLSLIGLAMIFSTAGVNYLLRQTNWLVLSILVCLVFANLSPRFYLVVSPYIYLFTIIALFLLLFISDSYPKRWLKFGAISIQLSEFSKFSTILFLAGFLARREKIEKFTEMLVPLFIVSIPAGLIFVEPDLGAAQMFLPILILMLYWAGMPAAKILIFFSPLVSAVASFSVYIWIGYMVSLALFLYFRKRLTELVYGLLSNPLAGLLMPVFWNSLKSYQQKRIISFFSPWLDPQGMSWQIIQSKIAIGSGQLIGKGFLSGTQKKLEFLPERHTDFIFSCIGEEFGLVGIVLIISGYLYLFYKIAGLARQAKNRFSSLFVIGVLAWFGYQTFLNTGMTIGLLPITGVPLPFISYGGSSLIACFMAIGVVLSISGSKFEY